MSILIFVLTSAIAGASSTCGPRLASFRQLEKLNPALALHSDAIGNYESQFLLLKREEALYSKGKLPPQLVDHLRSRHSARFDFSSMSDNDLRGFYVNSIRQLYVRIAAQWKRDEIKAMNVPEDKADSVMRLIESYWSPWSLEDPDLSAETAQELFLTKPWRRFPWLTAHSSLELMSWPDYERWRNAQIRQRRGIMCCQSGVACRGCPLNRQWLKPSKDH